MKKDNWWGSFIEVGFFIFGVNGLLSAILWTFTHGDDHYLWFSRFALGIVCFGFYGILRLMRKNKEI